MAGCVEGNPTRGIVEVMEELEKAVLSDNPTVDLQLCVNAIHFAAQFASSFGGGMKFVVIDILHKAQEHEKAYQKYNTVEAMLNYEITNGLARDNSSHTRNHLRMKRAGDLLRVFFQEILAREGESLVAPLRKAYDEVYSAYHGDNVKNAVYAGLEWVIDKTEFFNLIDDDDDKVRELLRRYISAATTVSKHVEQLYLSTEVGQDLLRMI